MPYLVVVTANARKDIQEAINWEDKRHPRLEIRFLADFEQRLPVISTSPKIFAVRYRNIRCVGTKIFQYLIHFSVDDITQRVIILRVLHTSRIPVW